MTIYSMVDYIVELWTFFPEDDFIFYDHDDVCVENYHASTKHNFYPSVLNHLCEIHYTPAQYDDMRRMSNALNYIVTVQLKNPLNPETEQLRRNLQKALDFHISNLTEGIRYNFFTCCYWANTIDPGLMTPFLDFARFATPEFHSLFRSLVGLFLECEKGRTISSKTAFFRMNWQVEWFLAHTPVELFNDHPILNIEVASSPLLATLKYVAKAGLNFIFRLDFLDEIL